MSSFFVVCDGNLHSGTKKEDVQKYDTREKDGKKMKTQIKIERNMKKTSELNLN